MNNESKSEKKNKLSYITIPFPIIFLLFSITLIIVFSWIRKENFDVGGLIFILLCMSTITFRKCFEVTEREYNYYNQYLFFKSHRTIETFEKIDKININKIEKEIAITDSWHRSSSASASNYYYAMNIETDKEKNVIVYKSKDYNRVMKIGKFFSNFYHIQISKENVMIEYPEYDRLNERNKKLKPKIKRKNN